MSVQTTSREGLLPGCSALVPGDPCHPAACMCHHASTCHCVLIAKALSAAILQAGGVSHQPNTIQSPTQQLLKANQPRNC